MQGEVAEDDEREQEEQDEDYLSDLTLSASLEFGAAVLEVLPVNSPTLRGLLVATSDGLLTFRPAATTGSRNTADVVIKLPGNGLSPLKTMCVSNASVAVPGVLN